MAPPRSDAWKYVTVVTTVTGSSGVKVVKCVFCFMEYRTNNATRITKHLQSCAFADDAAKSLNGQIVRDKGKSVAPPETTVVSTSAVASTSCSENVSVTGKYRRVTDWVNRMSDSERNRCDTELSLAFFSGGIPFRFIENPHLMRAMSILRPGYEPPSRRQLSGRMLDDCHASIEAEMNAEISGAMYVSVATDAWTNVNGESVINFIVLMPTKPVFYEAVYIADNRHTADYLVEATSAIIKKIGEEKVVAVVMDNAAANVSAAKALQENFKNTTLTCVGCAAHWINLLAKDITKISMYQQTLSKAVQVIKMFTNRHVLAAKLADIQQHEYNRQISLQMPVETRWMTHCNALKSLVDSKTALQQFCVRPESSSMMCGEKEVGVKRNVLSDGFWVDVTELRAQLEPLSGVILQLEKNNGMLSSVYQQFQNLFDFYTISNMPNADQVLKLFESRWHEYFMPAVAIAHLVNPANVDQCSDSLLLEKAEMYIRQRFEETTALQIISSLWCYLSKSRGFSPEMFAIFDAGTPPVVWWSRGRFGNQHDALRSLALKLLHIPATSAASERNWSAFRFIHTRLRNKLGSSRVQKLVYIFENKKPVDANVPLDEVFESFASSFDNQD